MCSVRHFPASITHQIIATDIFLGTFSIVTAFTVEADDSASQQDGQTNSSRRLPIEGLLTTYGYVLSHPDKANRLSIWFTDGSLEVVDSRNEMAWRDIFARGTTLEDDGKMSYHLPKPEGGGGTYVDVLFMDETLRIVRASTELIYVFSRVPCFPDE